MELSNKDKQYRILKEKNILKGIFILALPVMLNNVLKSLHDMVDIIVVGNMNQDISIITAQKAAIGFVGPVISICQALALGLMTAGLAIMSQYIGASKNEKSQKTSTQLLMLSIAIGIIINIVLYFGAPLVLKLMRALPDVYDPALRYLRIRSFEMISLFIFFAYQASRQSLGDTIRPVIWNVASILVNLILTIILVLGFNMDLAGAAIATVIANWSIVPICIISMAVSKQNKLVLKELLPDFKVVLKLFKLGVPAALSQAFTSLGFVIINAMMSSYQGMTKDILSGITTCNRINSLLLFPAMGVGTVLATFVGQNIGANNIKRARMSFLSALGLSLLISVIGSLIMIPFRTNIASWLGARGAELELCDEYLLYLLLGLPLMSIFQCFNGCFQGAGRTNLSLILSTSRLWLLRVPVLYLMLFVFDVGVKSVWICMNISNFGAFFIGCILYVFVDFKPRIANHKKIIEEKKEIKYGTQ